MILGLNLAVEPYSIGLVHQNAILLSYSIRASYDFTESLIDQIQHLLETVSVSFDQIEAVGVVVGPGSYTGLRIGVSTAKTIGQLYKLPVFDLNTFYSLLYPFRYQDGVYLCGIPARKKEYNVVLLACHNAQIKSLTPEFSLSESKLKEFLSTVNDSIKIIGLGPILSGYSHTIPGVIRGEILSFMAQERLVCGENGDYRTVRPVYSHQPQLGST